VSDIFALDLEGQNALKAEAAMNPVELSQADPSFWKGVTKGIGMGVMRGGAETADAMQSFGRLFDAPGTDQDATDELAADIHHSSVDYWTPAPAEVGKAGQVLGGLGEITLPLMAGGGNPALLVGTETNKVGKQLVDQGVDASTATEVAVLQGAATAVGFRLPFLGKTLTSRVLSGAGGNLALNAGTTAAQQQLLKQAGEEKVAEQFDPLNLEARAIDVLTGVAFGSLAHLQLRPSDRAAVATANNAKHFQHDTAPGVPADVAASVAHQDAMELATDQLVRGETVNVGKSGVQDATYVPKPSASPDLPELQDIEQAVRPSTPARDDASIETRFAADIAADPLAAEARYAQLPESQGGKVLNTDTARELSPDYLADRTRSAAVHEPASALIKQIYARKLQEAPAPGERSLVLFTAGGTGAGKSTAIRNALGNLAEVAQIVYDTNMNGVASSIAKIDQALAAGKDVTIAYTYREPIAALREGALPRAMRQEGEFGSGRTVPVKEHLKTHLGARESMERIAAHYAGDPRVQIKVLDNSGAAGSAKPVALSSIPKFEGEAYTRLREEALHTLQTERAAGRISESVYRGFADEGANPRAVSRAVQQSPRAGTGGEPEPQRLGEGADKLDPIVSAAHAALTTSDLRIPTGEIGADGHPVTTSAREMMAKAQADIAQAEHDSKSFEAAVSCFLQGGGA
jgi:hypothetical protein